MPAPMACRTLGQAARRKAHRLALAEALILFFLSYCVGKTLKSVNVCLQCPVFNALGAAVCRPRCLAGRWAGQRAERHVTWPWRRRRFFFSLSYCVGKTLKSVNVCLQFPVFNASGRQCAAPNQLPDAGPGGTPKGASPGLGEGLNANFCLVLGASSMGKRVAGVKQVWQCSVLLAIWRRYELHLLNLRELFPLQTHWLISMPRSSDNLGNKVG